MSVLPLSERERINVSRRLPEFPKCRSCHNRCNRNVSVSSGIRFDLLSAFPAVHFFRCPSSTHARDSLHLSFFFDSRKHGKHNECKDLSWSHRTLCC